MQLYICVSRDHYKFVLYFHSLQLKNSEMRNRQHNEIMKIMKFKSFFLSICSELMYIVVGIEGYIWSICVDLVQLHWTTWPGVWNRFSMSCHVAKFIWRVTWQFMSISMYVFDRRVWHRNSVPNFWSGTKGRSAELIARFISFLKFHAKRVFAGCFFEYSKYSDYFDSQIQIPFNWNEPVIEYVIMCTLKFYHTSQSHLCRLDTVNFVLKTEKWIFNLQSSTNLLSTFNFLFFNLQPISV